MKKLVALFALSALSAAVLAEGETPTTATTPVAAYSPYAMTEAQQAMIAERQQAMAQAFETQRQFIEQQQKAMQEAFEEQRQLAEQMAAEQARYAQAQAEAMQKAFEEQQKLIAERPQAYAPTPFATPDVAAFPMPFAEPPAMPTPFAETNPMVDLPQPPSYTELRTLSPEDRRAAMKEYAKQRRAAADKYHAEMIKQFDAEREAVLREARTYM